MDDVKRDLAEHPMIRIGGWCAVLSAIGQLAVDATWQLRASGLIGPSQEEMEAFGFTAVEGIVNWTSWLGVVSMLLMIPAAAGIYLYLRRAESLGTLQLGTMSMLLGAPIAVLSYALYPAVEAMLFPMSDNQGESSFEALGIGITGVSNTLALGELALLPLGVALVSWAGMRSEMLERSLAWAGILSSLGFVVWLNADFLPTISSMASLLAMIWLIVLGRRMIRG